jgi:hypothetical protein
MPVAVLKSSIEVPSQDKLDGHRWARTRWRARFEQAIQPPTYRQRAHGKRYISITRFIGYRQREYDYGNLVGGCRPLVDALVRLRWLVDDRPACLLAEYMQRKAAGRSGVEIRIFAAEREAIEP